VALFPTCRLTYLFRSAKFSGQIHPSDIGILWDRFKRMGEVAMSAGNCQRKYRDTAEPQDIPIRITIRSWQKDKLC
jgi:hypothetical protein